MAASTRIKFLFVCVCVSLKEMRFLTDYSPSENVKGNISAMLPQGVTLFGRVVTSKEHKGRGCRCKKESQVVKLWLVRMPGLQSASGSATFSFCSQPGLVGGGHSFVGVKARESMHFGMDVTGVWVQFRKVAGGGDMS